VTHTLKYLPSGVWIACSSIEKSVPQNLNAKRARKRRSCLSRLSVLVCWIGCCLILDLHLRVPWKDIYGGWEKACVQIQADLESSSARFVDFATVVRVAVNSVSCAPSSLTIPIFSLCKERWFLLVYEQPSSGVNSF
jgi:hypothetical protein